MEQLDGVVTKRGAWLDSKGRVLLEIDGSVIIADDCEAKAGDRVACRGLARAAVENTATPCYRARKTATITIVEAHDAPPNTRNGRRRLTESRVLLARHGRARARTALDPARSRPDY